MRKFILKLIAIIIPIFIICLPVLFIGYYSGEFVKFDKLIVDQRDNHEVLIGMGYNEQTPYYKLTNANYYQTDVLALGSSRVMQFKNFYFTSSFYNCGGAVSGNFDVYLNFLENLNYTPKVVVLGLDSWLFNENGPYTAQTYYSFSAIHQTTRSQYVMAKGFVRDYINKKWTLSSFDNYPLNKGFNGKIHDDGFMWDGSYYYGYIYRYPEKQNDFQFKSTFTGIERGTSLFEYGDRVYEATLLMLDSLLSYCSDKGIEVIGFIPPFAPSVYQKMIASGNYAYLSQLVSVCNPIFEKYDFEFYNFISPSDLYIFDNYYVDGIHGGEVAYGILAKEMINTNSVLKQYIDEPKLDELIANKYSDLVFYEP